MRARTLWSFTRSVSTTTRTLRNTLWQVAACGAQPAADPRPGPSRVSGVDNKAFGLGCARPSRVSAVLVAAQPAPFGDGRRADVVVPGLGAPRSSRGTTSRAAPAASALVPPREAVMYQAWIGRLTVFSALASEPGWKPMTWGVFCTIWSTRACG